jgi:hypothetical protein
MVRVMDGPYTGPFNIGNPTEFTMLELAEVVKEVVNPNARIIFKENTSDDPTRRKPDISKVHQPPPRSPCSVAAGKFSHVKHDEAFHALPSVPSNLAAVYVVFQVPKGKCCSKPVAPGFSVCVWLWQAKKMLGWEPKVPLREGLSRMVDDFAKRLGVEAPEVPGRA